MIRQSIIMLLLAIPFMALSQEDLTMRIAYDFDQMTEIDQNLITNASEECLKKLIDKDIEGFWASCHPEFKEATPLVSFKEIGKILSNMLPSMDSIEFVDAKKVDFTTTPTTSMFSTGGSLDQSDPTYLQFYTLEGMDKQAISIYKTISDQIARAITLKFGLLKGKYLLTSFEINACALNGKDATYYLDLANKWASKDTDISRFIALNMAYKLSYLCRGTSTKQLIDIITTVQKLQKDSTLISEFREWTVQDSVYDVINIDFIETESDITPNIMYLSKRELGEINTEEESKLLFRYFMNKYPDLANEFKVFLFQAYEDYPALQTKQYTYYRVIMDVDEMD
ncbi:MAG: hypothetical protein HN921_10360 [Bacteroidetes bacterium]|nr:hypothetical protein [Bacteroidota bacterium]